jgi:hypothetical protein
VGSGRDCTWILGLLGFRVVAMNSETEGGRLMIRVKTGSREPEGQTDGRSREDGTLRVESRSICANFDEEYKCRARILSQSLP